jgi:S-layer protein
LALSGTSNYKVSGNTTGAITSTATGTLTVTSSANDQTITSNSATTVNAAALTGDAGNTDGVVTLKGAAAGTSFTVTGLGTAALNGNGDEGEIKEDTALRGDVTVNTAGTVKTTVTQTAGNTGTFTLNVAGTGAVTYTATSSHADQVINLNSTGAVTVQNASTATAYTITVGGTAGARGYTSDGNTAAIDTYIGGSGVDTVDLGQGADSFTSGGGNDVYTITVATDTAVALGFAKSAAVPTTALSTLGMDVITGMTAGMTIATGLTTASQVAFVRNGGTMPDASNAANTANALIVGTYSASANTFTPSLAGSDSLYVVDNNGDTANGGYNGIVLVGYVDALQNDTISNAGVFTAVAG